MIIAQFLESERIIVMRSPIKSNQIDMLHGRLLGKLVLFALPLALSSIL